MMRATQSADDALLVLKDGRVFRGQAFGHRGRTVGEVVFNTSMAGYQEILTDPSYCGQLMTFTLPHIGNVGVNADDEESDRVWVSGVIAKEFSKTISNYRSEESLADYLLRRQIVGISDLDTRALVRHIRETGAQMAILTSDPQDVEDLNRLKLEASKLGTMAGKNLAREVTCKAAYEWPGDRAGGTFDLDRATFDGGPAPSFHVVAYDFGIKRNILRHLVARGCRVTVVPAGTRASEVLALKPDGIFLSNGPGDPAVVEDGIKAVRGLIGKLPIFGICLGHQILALALGGETYKLKFGHRGGNHPVMDRTTGKVEISAQNHGFAVKADSLPSRIDITHVNLNDHTVEGLSLKSQWLFSVQYHPEASPGPHDSHYLFDRFVEWMGEFKALGSH